MIIYQVSCTMPADIAEKWEQFFIEKHLNDVVKTGFFRSYSFRRLISSDESSEVTFIAEYLADNMEQIEAYNREAAADLKKEVIDLFEGRFTASRSLHHIIQENH